MRSLLIAVLLLLSLAPLALAQSGQFDPAAEQQLVQLVNQERAKAGLPALAVDDRLTRAAREHTVLMAQHSTLSHEFPGELKVSKRLAGTGLRFNNDGENVAMDSGTVEDVHSGLMHSPPHRANILSPKYNTIGIGVTRQGGAYWATEDFAYRLPEVSSNQAEDLAAESFARARRANRAPAAARETIRNLRSMACGMEKQGALNTRPALALPGVHYAIGYTEGQPQNLPASALRLAAEPGIKRFAVGACFGARGEKYPSGTWWVLMVFF